MDAEVRGPGRLHISVRADRATLRLTATGALDQGTARSIATLVHSLVEPSCIEVRLDLSGVEIADDEGLGIVRRCGAQLARDGRRFVIDGAGEPAGVG